MSPNTGSCANSFRLPVWMCFVAATFIAYYAVMFYAELFEPRRIGIDCAVKEGGIIITGVTPTSPASRASMDVGDRLLSVDGSAIHTWEDWSRFVGNREFGRNYRFTLERKGQRTEVQLKVGRQPGDQLARLERKRYVQFFVLLLALGQILYRPRLSTAQVGALFLAGIGTAPIFPSAEMTAVWRHLPMPLGAALWIPEITHLMLLPLFFAFFALLPRSLFKSSWPWIVMWSPALILAGWWSPHIYEHVYHPPVLAELPAWFRFMIGLAIFTYGWGALAALLANYLRLSGLERRSLRVLLVGSCIGWFPSTLFLSAMFWGTLTESEMVWLFVSTKYRLFSLACFIAFPVSLTYALIRHRIFDFAANPAP